MLAEKSTITNLNPPKIRLQPAPRSIRQRVQPPPTPVFNSSSAKAAHIANNIAQLKAKYMDYATWLKSSSRTNREPIVTQELLKSSLCRMGIETKKAERLVNNCSWYVYQFEKGLKPDNEKKNQLVILDNNNGKTPLRKTTKIHNIEDSMLYRRNDALLGNHLPPIPGKNRTTVHGSNRSDILSSDVSYQSSRSILKEQQNSNKTQTTSSDSTIDYNLSSSYNQNERRQGLAASQTRSILRKTTISSNSSSVSTDIASKKFVRSRILTPSSIDRDSLPLGTRSQRLFGGSDYFAEIMNELEQQR